MLEKWGFLVCAERAGNVNGGGSHRLKSRHTLAALFLLLALPAHAEVKVLDGDTIRIDGETIRVMNIDAPEIHPCRCQAECDLGYRAKEFTERFLSGPVTLERASRRDRYNRVLAKVSVNGNDLGEALIGAGLARKWTGRRLPWC